MIKHGHAGALAAWGVRKHGAAAVFEVSLAANQQLLIDHPVRHVKANGSTAPKVFKGRALSLAAGESRRLIRAAGEASFELRV